MISLINVTRYHGPPSDPRFVLNDVSLRVEPMDRIGILAPSGSGKSTLARIISGHERPDAGHVIRGGHLSWPMGFSAALHPALKVADNIATVATLRNMDPYELVTKVEDFAQIGASFFRPLSELAPGERSQVALALSLSVVFDIYLADDMNVSANPAFREKCDAALMDRLASAGLIMMSRHPRMLKAFATRFFVLAHAGLIECETAAQAEDILNLLIHEDVPPHAIA